MVNFHAWIFPFDQKKRKWTHARTYVRTHTPLTKSSMTVYIHCTIHFSFSHIIACDLFRCSMQLVVPNFHVDFCYLLNILSRVSDFIILFHHDCIANIFIQCQWDEMSSYDIFHWNFIFVIGCFCHPPSTPSQQYSLSRRFVFAIVFYWINTRQMNIFFLYLHIKCVRNKWFFSAMEI